MSRVTQKLAIAIATEMVARVFNANIQYTEAQLNNALTSIAKKRIPEGVFEFVKTYPEFITTTQWMSVTSIIEGQRVYLDGRVNEPIPNKPLYYAVGENTFKALRDIKDRIKNLRRKRAERHKRIYENIYECRTTTRLEKEYPYAYKVMLELKAIEESEKI